MTWTPGKSALVRRMLADAALAHAPLGSLQVAEQPDGRVTIVDASGSPIFPAPRRALADLLAAAPWLLAAGVDEIEQVRADRDSWRDATEEQTNRATSRYRELEERVAAAELRATALERELGVAQEAARELGTSYLRDERPPARALSYATSLPAPATPRPAEGTTS